MALEKNTNPLPDGRYWVDVFDPHREAFNGWLADNKDSVRVENTESDESSNPAQSFYLFSVKNHVQVPGGTSTIFVPVNWDAKTFGFPTIAPPNVKSKADTVQKPDLPPDGLDGLGNALGSGGLMAGLESGLKIAGYGIGAWLLLKLISAFGNNKS